MFRNEGDYPEAEILGLECEQFFSLPQKESIIDNLDEDKITELKTENFRLQESLKAKDVVIHKLLSENKAQQQIQLVHNEEKASLTRQLEADRLIYNTAVALPFVLWLSQYAADKPLSDAILSRNLSLIKQTASSVINASNQLVIQLSPIEVSMLHLLAAGIVPSLVTELSSAPQLPLEPQLPLGFGVAAGPEFGLSSEIKLAGQQGASSGSGHRKRKAPSSDIGSASLSATLATTFGSGPQMPGDASNKRQKLAHSPTPASGPLNKR